MRKLDSGLETKIMFIDIPHKSQLSIFKLYKLYKNCDSYKPVQARQFNELHCFKVADRNISILVSHGTFCPAIFSLVHDAH